VREEEKAGVRVKERDARMCIYEVYVVVMPSGLCERECVRETKQRRDRVWKRETYTCEYLRVSLWLCPRVCARDIVCERESKGESTCGRERCAHVRI